MVRINYHMLFSQLEYQNWPGRGSSRNKTPAQIWTAGKRLVTTSCRSLMFFFLIELLKKKCVDKNNKIKILRTFDNPISKNRTQNKKSFLLGLAVLDYFPNSKRVLKVGFDTYILHNFSKFCHGVFYQFVSFNIISRLLPKIINMYF